MTSDQEKEMLKLEQESQQRIEAEISANGKEPKGKAKPASPMDGVTKKACRIMGLAPGYGLPDIDQAKKLADLELFVNSAMVIQNPDNGGMPKIVARKRKQAVSYAVCECLTRYSRLILDIGDDNRTGRPYLISDDLSSWPLDYELMQARAILAETGLNATETTFKWVIADLERIALNNAPKIELARFWCKKSEALYISAGPNKIIKAIMTDGIPQLTMLPNGSEGIYFASDATLPDWNISDNPQSPMTLAALNPPLVTAPVAKEYTAEIQKLLLQAWLVALLADIRPLPLLVATGNSDGGKTTLISAVLKLLLDSQPTTPSEDARDLWTLAVQRPAIGLDNVDGDPPGWLADFLAALVTGVSYDRRKLHTNTRIDSRKARATALISSRTAACVSRPDVAQRSLPLLTGGFDDGRKADSDLVNQIEGSRDACLTWLAMEAVKMLANIKKAPALADIRFVDFARVVWSFDSERAGQAISALQQAQSQVVGESDELLAVIIEKFDELVAPMGGQWRGTPANLVKALNQIGADLNYQGGGKAIAGKLREGIPTLKLFGIALSEQSYGNGTLFIITNTIRF